MTLSSQMSRPSPSDWQFLTALSTVSGRRTALYATLQCLLSVVGSIGIILLFAGIPHFVYYREVTANNILTVVCGGLLVCLMIGGNSYIGHIIRQNMHSVLEPEFVSFDDDKPPSYEELMADLIPPPDYSTVIAGHRKQEGEEFHLVEVACIHQSQLPLPFTKIRVYNEEDSSANSSEHTCEPSLRRVVSSPMNINECVLNIEQNGAKSLSSIDSNSR